MVKMLYLCSVNNIIHLNLYAYEKEKSRKLCKIGQKAW